MTSKYMNFSPQLVNERNAALNNCPTKSGRSQIYKIYYIKMKDAYKKYEEAIEDDEEDYEEDDDDDDEDYEPSEDEEYEEEYEASEADTSEADTSEDEDEADQDEEESACERKVPDQDANACETEADQEYCCCCEAANADASETEEAASACETEAAEEEAASACETEAEEAEENEFGCPGCNYEWRDGYKNGWKDAMKYIAGRTHKEVPATPACSYCDIVCKTRKCGGKCGGVVRYCSVDCQKQDWAFGHKNICCK